MAKGFEGRASVRKRAEKPFADEDDERAGSRRRVARGGASK